jgi:hypothetical protein
VTGDECVVVPVVANWVIRPYVTPLRVEYLQVADSSVVMEIIVAVVFSARVPDGNPFDNTGAETSDWFLLPPPEEIRAITSGEYGLSPPVFTAVTT